MKRYFLCALGITIVLCPLLLHAGDFELTDCSFGYFTPLHGESNLPHVTNYHQRGVIKNNKADVFLNNATYYLEGIQVGSDLNDIRLGKREKGQGRYEIIIMDEDGDMILGYESTDGDRITGKFTHGTGKYKAINAEYRRIEYKGKSDELKEKLKEHLEMVPPIDTGYMKETRSYEICNTIQGNIP
jgi:hypothetical protein